MRNNNRIILLIFILPIFLITGCVSTITVPERGKIQYPAKPPALSNDTLDKRIDNLKNILKEGGISEEKKETAVLILKTYDKLKSLNRGNNTEKEYIRELQILFDSFVTIEQQYFDNIVLSGGEAGKKVIEDYSSLIRKIYQDYFAGNFNGVILGCTALESKFGKNGLTPDLGIILVESLSKNGMTSEALTVARSILGTLETRPDLIRLLADAIELELKTGDTEDAKGLYEKLVDNINERYRTYQKVGNLLSEHQGDNSIVDESVKEKMTGINPEKKIEIKQLLDNVEKLISQKDFSGARLQLFRWRLKAEEGPEVDLIEQALKSVDKAEEQFNNQNNNDRLVIDDAKKLIEQEKFDEALNLLEPLVAKGGNYEAEKLKKQAIEELINREILNAAKLKLAAKNESDIQKKRALLVSSKAILSNLIEKYPSSPQINKLKSYSLKIDDELTQLPDSEE